MIALGNDAGLFRRQCEPVFGAKTFNPLELGEVAGDDHEAAAAGVTSDEDVVGADHLAAAFEIGVDFPRMGGCILVERQDGKPRCKAFDALPNLYGRADLAAPCSSSARVMVDMQSVPASALKRGRRPSGRSRSSRMKRLVSSMLRDIRRVRGPDAPAGRAHRDLLQVPRRSHPIWRMPARSPGAFRPE